MSGTEIVTFGCRLNAFESEVMREHAESKVLITDREFSDVVADALSRMQRPPMVIDIDDPISENKSIGKINSRDKLVGMVDAFGPADFSGMGGEGLFIDEVIHKARVGVDEKGTEAAAATSVILLGIGFAEGGPVEMTIDRPFIFLIRDNAAGATLFLGRVMDPRG